MPQSQLYSSAYAVWIVKLHEISNYTVACLTLIKMCCFKGWMNIRGSFLLLPETILESRSDIINQQCDVQ